jgi:hypothetical protein
MPRKYGPALVLIALVIALAVCITLAWVDARRDVQRWPQFAYFRCLTCAGPASINPDEPVQWGCRSCRFATFKIRERFRMAAIEDFGGDGAQLWEAQKAAGVMAHPDARYITPSGVWLRAGGRSH